MAISTTIEEYTKLTIRLAKYETVLNDVLDGGGAKRLRKGDLDISFTSVEHLEREIARIRAKMLQYEGYHSGI